MNVELVAQMFKNYQSNVLFHLEGRSFCARFSQFEADPEFHSHRQSPEPFITSPPTTSPELLVMAPSATEPPLSSARREPKSQPPTIWHAAEPPFAGYKPADPSGYKQSSAENAIVIDNGMAKVRKRPRPKNTQTDAGS